MNQSTGQSPAEVTVEAKMHGPESPPRKCLHIPPARLRGVREVCEEGEVCLASASTPRQCAWLRGVREVYEELTIQVFRGFIPPDTLH